MIRLLHLLGNERDFENVRSAQTLSARLGGEFSVARRIIGQDPPYRNPVTLAAAVRSETFDLLHLFGEPALLAAAVTVRRPILYSPGRFPHCRLINWLRAIVVYRDVHVLCPTATMQRVLVENGLPLARCPLVRPGVDFSRIKTQRDLGLRGELGLSDTDQVLLAVGESTRAARHTELVWAASMLHLLDKNLKLLLWGRGPLVGKAARLARSLKQPNLLRVAEHALRRPVSWEQLLGAADAAVVSASAPVATLPILIAMASMRPVISTVTYSAAELLEDRHTSLMTPRRQPRQLAQRIMDLQSDPSLGRAITDRARAEAYELFPQTRFVQEMRKLYTQLTA